MADGSLEGKNPRRVLNFLLVCLFSCRLKQHLTELVHFTTSEAATEQL